MTTRRRTQDGVSGEETFRTLKNRSELPPRVYELLAGLLGHGQVYFSQAVPKALDDVSNALFRLAERASNNTLQQQHLESSRAINLGSGDIASRFLQHLESSLALVRTEQTPAKPATPELRRNSQHPALELVDSSVLDEDITLREISSKAEVRHSQDLYLLTHRMAVLAGSPIWSVDTVPLGPAQLAAAFRHALDGVELPIASRLLAYRHFDGTAIRPIGAFYEALNHYFEEQRVLPNLRPQTFRRTGSSPRAGVAEGASATTEDAAAHSPPPGQEPTTTSKTAARTEPAGDADLYASLRHLLRDHRHLTDHEPALSASTRTASGEHLQDLLASLQHRALAHPAEARRLDSEHLRNTLMVKLRRTGSIDHHLDLSEEDSDTVDLIGMLFDHMAVDLRMGNNARDLLSRLHVPVLRVALSDKTFFTRRDHPARELLNTIGETAAHWIDEHDTDSDLIRRMQDVVDHVSSDFDGDVGIFETLLNDLSRHMQALARRAELAERRHVDAARSRDKLDLARETARAAIERIVQTHQPGRIARSLLEQAWVDVLALTVLRHGADSEEFRLRIKTAVKLARHSLKAPQDDRLREELDGGLSQVGMHESDLHGVLNPLFMADAPDPEASRRADETLAARTRLGGEVAEAPASEKTKQDPLSAAENEALVQLRTLPFGTWFEFATTEDGAWARRKLAWYSTVSGRCLFVYANGAQAGHPALEELARDMVSGKARVHVQQHVSMIDRAWKTVMDVLKSTVHPSKGAAVAGANA